MSRKTHVIPQTAAKHTALIIFLHGAGDTGEGVEDWVKCCLFPLETGMVFPHIKVIYPTAPKQPYTPDRGRINHIWFDWSGVSPDLPEYPTSIDPMCEEICQLIETEITSGTPPHRIILGGLSMGGAMALHVGYRFRRDLAGVFALSTFLSNTSSVYKALQSNISNNPPLFMAHGGQDQLILPHSGQNTFERLVELGVPAEYHSYAQMTHAMCKTELEELQTWILKLLPDIGAPEAPETH